MHVILVSVGTDGDVFPYVGLGEKLRSRGHRVTLTASAPYEPLARAHGFAFQALVSEEEHRELFGDPDFWNPWKNAPLMARWGVRFIQRQYDLLSTLNSEDTALAASPGVFAAALVHEKVGTPLVNLILQPWMIPSSIAPPIMPGFTFLRRAPRPVWKVFWGALDVVVDILVGRHLNRLRSSLGLKPLRRILQNWLSPPACSRTLPGMVWSTEGRLAATNAAHRISHVRWRTGRRSPSTTRGVLPHWRSPSRVHVRDGNGAPGQLLPCRTRNVRGAWCARNFPHEISGSATRPASVVCPSQCVRSVSKAFSAMRSHSASWWHRHRGKGDGRRHTTIDLSHLF